MHDALVVGRRQPLRHLARDRHDPGHRQLALTAQQVGQRLAGNERHGQVLEAVDIADVVNADDVLVGDLTGQHQLALEAQLEVPCSSGVQLRTRANHLDGDAHTQLVVERVVDRAHAAGAE